MKMLAAIVLLLALGIGTARADSCDRSREYLLGGLWGKSGARAAILRGFVKICTSTAAIPNVKAAYILRDGGIAVVAKQDSVAATAGALSQFCNAHPKSTPTLTLPAKRCCSQSRS